MISTLAMPGSRDATASAPRAQDRQDREDLPMRAQPRRAYRRGMHQITKPRSELKAKHAAMWASGDYPSMVETFLLPLGPRLVGACALGPGVSVLDVAAGTGNASLPA